MRRFPRKVVHDAARDVVLIFAGEFLGVSSGIRVWRTICVAFQRDDRYPDDREFGKPLFEIGVSRFALATANGSYGSRWPREPACRRTQRCDRTWRRRSSIWEKRSAR